MRWDNERADWVDERLEETPRSRFAARVGALIFLVGLWVTFLGLGLVFTGKWWIFSLGVAMTVAGDYHRKWYWKKFRKTHGKKNKN